MKANTKIEVGFLVDVRHRKEARRARSDVVILFTDSGFKLG